MPEALWFKLCGHGWLVQHGVISFFSFGWWDIANPLQQPPVIEPIDPFQRREFNGLEVPPRPIPMNDLSLVKPVDGFCERVVIRIPNAANRWFDACFGQPLSLLYRHVLATAIRVMNKPAAMKWPPIMEGFAPAHRGGSPNAPTG